MSSILKQIRGRGSYPPRGRGRWIVTESFSGRVMQSVRCLCVSVVTRKTWKRRRIRLLPGKCQRIDEKLVKSLGISTRQSLLLQCVANESIGLSDVIGV